MVHSSALDHCVFLCSPPRALCYCNKADNFCECDLPPVHSADIRSLRRTDTFAHKAQATRSCDGVYLDLCDGVVLSRQVRCAVDLGKYSSAYVGRCIRNICFVTEAREGIRSVALAGGYRWSWNDRY